MCKYNTGSIPNKCLTKKDLKELNKDKKLIKNIKVSKKSYFKGFKESKNEHS
jgi:hypothetical protein